VKYPFFVALWLFCCGSGGGGGLQLFPIQIYRISFVNPIEHTHTNMGNSTPKRPGVFTEKGYCETDIPVIMIQ